VVLSQGAGRPQRESPSNRAAYPGREKPHSQLKAGSRGPDHQLKTELTELSTLSRQIVLGEDKDNEAAITEADRVCLEAIAAIDEFLQ
jgi:hypothetical protein